MSVVGYETLRTAKAALDEGLINTGDFDNVKTAFLRAQQIKAGLDAGFIREADYENVKQAFFGSLSLSSDTAAVAAAQPRLRSGSPCGKGESSAAGALPTFTSGSLHQESSLPAVTASPKAPAAPQAAVSNGQRHVPTDRAAAAGTAAPQAAPQRAPQAEPTPPAGPSPRAGKTAIPTHIPRMGGARPKQQSGTSMSGIAVTEDAINLYYYLKAKSVYRWATWRINDTGNQVIIANVGDKDSGYSEFLEVLPASDCRYGVIDMKFTNSEGCIFNKILFINWAPDSARIKAKMMYASTKDFFKGYLDGLSIELQGSDLEDISEHEAMHAVRTSVTRQ